MLARVGLRREDGTVVVEFGLIFPVIVLLIAGLVAFGLAYDIQLTLQQAAREAVRVYALGSGDPNATAQDAATNLGSIGVETSGNCEDPTHPGDPAPQAWVRVSYDMDFGFVPMLEFPDMTLSSRAVMRCGG